MDADGSHPPEELPAAARRRSRTPTWCSARAGCPAGGRELAAHRELLCRGGNPYTRLALGIPLQRRDRRLPRLPAQRARGAALASVASQGYCFQVDLAWRALQAGFRVVEVPITFVERERGASKMSRAIVLEALWRVTWWGVRRRRGQDRRTLHVRAEA